MLALEKRLVFFAESDAHHALLFEGTDFGLSVVCKIFVAANGPGFLR